MERYLIRKRKSDEEEGCLSNTKESDKRLKNLGKDAPKSKNKVNEKENEWKEKENKKEKELLEREKMLEKQCVELLKKEEELDKKCEAKKAEIDQLKKLAQEVTDKVECPVCMDPPRSGPVYVCPNGHLVCKKCKRATCPTCRTGMGEVKSLLALTIIENIYHKCRFDGCGDNFPLTDIEKHEATCHFRTVLCPSQNCSVEVSLPKLVEHLLKSEKCCRQTAQPKKALACWNNLDFTFTDYNHPKATWSLNIFSFSGETFAVFPNKVQGQFFFVLVMFNTEEESSKYKFEIVVHEQQKSVENSELKVRFEGSPVSVEVLKKEMSLYCASELMMQKILNKSHNKKMFNLSFKVRKK